MEEITYAKIKTSGLIMTTPPSSRVRFNMGSNKVIQFNDANSARQLGQYRPVLKWDGGGAWFNFIFRRSWRERSNRLCRVAS